MQYIFKIDGLFYGGNNDYINTSKVIFEMSKENEPAAYCKYGACI